RDPRPRGNTWRAGGRSQPLGGATRHRAPASAGDPGRTSRALGASALGVPPGSGGQWDLLHRNPLVLGAWHDGTDLFSPHHTEAARTPVPARPPAPGETVARGILPPLSSAFTMSGPAPSSFETLFASVVNVAYRSALHMARHRAEAEDLVQEAAF